jgi:hypothetical protein
MEKEQYILRGVDGKGKFASTGINKTGIMQLMDLKTT